MPQSARGEQQHHCKKCGEKLITPDSSVLRSKSPARRGEHHGQAWSSAWEEEEEEEGGNGGERERKKTSKVKGEMESKWRAGGGERSGASVLTACGTGMLIADSAS